VPDNEKLVTAIHYLDMVAATLEQEKMWHLSTKVSSVLELLREITSECKYNETKDE
jgi:hypothetical protein